jgi:predicted TIM-barrel fold metal-dependent hydrolase
MTKIIDTHVHLSGLMSDSLTGFAELNGLKYTLQEYLMIMRKLNIQNGLLLSPPLRDGGPVPNQKIIELCKKSGTRLLPVLTTEPSTKRITETLELAKRYRSEVKGFKIRLGYHTAHASDRIFEPVYDYAESEKLPVLFHTGDTATSIGHLRLSHPLELDELSNRRPDMLIVACHFGNPWFYDVAELVYKHENLYADISGLFAGGGSYGKEYMSLVASRLSQSIYYIGDARKILFGTDYPVTRPETTLKLVKMLKITDADKERILFDNAAELFRF